MKVVIPVEDGAVTLDSHDGIPVVVVELKVQDGTVQRVRHRIAYETVNRIRQWTEDAYPRSQER